ncbi:MAG: hypothetical protein HYU41_15250 [Candidatus Rokubacteria bacterium]|nr:hypothetical protein [Candidatus Rokubacteria bacterium]
MRQSAFVWAVLAVGVCAALEIAATSATRIGAGSRGDGAHVAAPAHAAWGTALARLTSAIEREDRASLLSDWRAAYAVGLASHRWEPLITLGDAAQRIAILDHQREPFRREARAAYLLALRTARRAQSDEGLMATADAFERLGDAEMATQVRRLAAHVHANASHP